MEWAVLLILAAAAVASIVLPRRTREEVPSDSDQQALLEERLGLYAELRELDEDAAAGRISADDRLRGRRALAPRLRAVTEELRARGFDEARE